MNKKHLIYLILVLGVVVLLMGWLLVLTPLMQPASGAGLRGIQLDGQTIHVSVADTDAARQLGLGGRAGLAPDEGMLFIFPVDGRYGFWMKDMKFSIDMVWIAADGTIVYIAPNVSPGTYPKTFGPSTPARYVLELPASYAASHNVNLGDKVQL